MIWNLFGTTCRTGQTVMSHRLLRRAAVVLLLAAGFCLITAGQIMAAAPGFADYLYRREIKIDHTKVCADVTGFPVLVTIESISNPSASISIKSVANGGKVSNSSGYDIVFTDAGGTQLHHEVEKYNPATGTLVAWVNVPALSAGADTVIYLYYGDSAVLLPTERPGDVWDGNNYQGVWHMNRQPTGAAGDQDIPDSTANTNDGISVAMNGDELTAGQIGDALEFNYDYVLLGDLRIHNNDRYSVSFWVKGATGQSDKRVFAESSTSSNSPLFNLGTDNSGASGKADIYIRDDNGQGRLNHAKTNDDVFDSTWHRFDFVDNDGTYTCYVDGAASGGGTYNPKQTKSFDTTSLGAIVRSAISHYFLGTIDEVRVSDILRDACWIETEYNNQSDPAAFYIIGDEEDTDALVTTYTITATADDPVRGRISPAGAVPVDEGKGAVFFLVAEDGYEVNQVTIDTDPPQDWSYPQYAFTDVRDDHTIHVTFKVEVVEVPLPGDDDLPPGCSENISADYSAGFDPANLDILNCEIDGNGHVKLNTGDIALDHENIVLPFRQQVAVTFMHEGGNNTETDFGWMLASEDPKGNPKPQRIVYKDINDNNDLDGDGEVDGDGALDKDGDDTDPRFEDRNGDGIVDARDNREILGTFEAGTELIFFLRVEEGDGYRDNVDNPYTGVPVKDFADSDDTVYQYSKTAWNGSIFTSSETMSSWDPLWRCDRAWGDPLKKFTKTYNLSDPKGDQQGCQQEDGWMDTDALARITNPFNLSFEAGDTTEISITFDGAWPAVMVGAPANDLNAWVMGFEDLVGGGDADHNDLVFVVERETGGTAELKSTVAISPTDPDANIQGVTLGVFDFMPDDACVGLTTITYYLSIDAGGNWVEVDGWDEVYNFTLVSGQKIVGDPVANWTEGTPAHTYRTRRVDFTGLGLSGKELIWRAEMRSRKEGCEPIIMDMALDLTVGVPGHIARSSPMVLANVMYSASLETPAGSWTSAELRGHLRATRIYDPTDPSQTNTQDLWDAGEVLKDQMDPDGRKIYIPDVTAYTVDSASPEPAPLAVGDGVTTFFEGRLANYPVLATTVQITDTHEIFTDQHTDVLDGSLTGTGWINRFTGEYRITFATPPVLNQPITAAYSYFTYNSGGTLREFKENNVPASWLGLDASEIIPSGPIYDFDNDDDFDAADANWLINWTRGYRDGNAKLVEKEWTLRALDHSVPALATPPATGSWYYGTAFPEDKPNSTHDRKGYRAFRDDEARAGRRTVVYAGARDGMLHAFDAGTFRWGNNPCTDIVDPPVTENRGFFQWTDPDDPDPNACKDACQAGCLPDYGSGRELWAFIPANLLPRLKNNLMQEDDMAYVDASPALADVHTGGDWRTVLLSAEGNGGDTIYCLDVTDPYTPKFMWEFADPDLFRSRSSPAVGQVGLVNFGGTAKWVAFFVSGKTYDTTKYPSIFVIDIADGSLLKKIVLDPALTGAGGVLSGQPAIVDSDGNGYLDRLYIGSDKGLLYKVNLPDSPDTVKYGIGSCVINTDYSDRDDNLVPDKWHYQPIYGSPSVVASNSVDASGNMIYDIRVFFGTGDSPFYDENINFSDTRYLFYAYSDTTTKGQCDDTRVALEWFFELPEGHRIYASAFSAAGNIYFGTSTGETEDPCDISANSDAGFDANAGMLFAFKMDPDVDPVTGKPIPILQRVVGNVLAAPVVEDKHLYYQSVSGQIESFGAGEYNTGTRQGGIPEIEIHWWREVF